MPITGTVTATGRLRVLTCRPIIPERGYVYRVITGALLQGDSLPIALDRATQFILQGIRATFGYEYDNREGIQLEKVLHNLDMPIQICSYELI